MAQKYLNSKEAAQALGVSVEDVKRMIDNRELYGYRDGGDWKFKSEDIERLVKDRSASGSDGDDDVLLSETDLGSFGSGTSGTVIGMKADKSSSESDLALAESDLNLAPAKPAQRGARSDELDLTLDEDISLEDSSPKASAAKPAVKGKAKPGDSAVDLAGKKMDDDELVLGGGSGVGSDVTLGGDSGISLVDPSDSGLSLEQPLDLGAAGEESLELGEDDMLSMAVEGSGVRMKSDDEFLLTPMADAGDGEDSESGSQVIALDTEGDESATMVGGAPMSAMLEEDLSTMTAPSMGGPLGGPMGAAAGQPMPMPGGMPMMGPSLPEAPYTGLSVTGLVLCTLLLLVCGMFTFDLVRNIWSWDSAYSLNSSMMDSLLGLIDGK